MKKLGFFIIMIFLIYIVQYDIRHGTLAPIKAVPASSQTPDISSQGKGKSTIPYISVKVKAGDTVLSIIEQLANGSVPVSIDKVITDFKSLNKGISPQNIQLGKTYKFPIYKES
ncbi:MAG TPA: hypothetical protein VNM45_16995 [Bacillus sp. (in: firmicutes)]|nr:hypothetical protein [Bacillus sp. (in: firmicutes)]